MAVGLTGLYSSLAMEHQGEKGCLYLRVCPRWEVLRSWSFSGVLLWLNVAASRTSMFHRVRCCLWQAASFPRKECWRGMPNGAQLEHVWCLDICKRSPSDRSPRCFLVTKTWLLSGERVCHLVQAQNIVILVGLTRTKASLRHQDSSDRDSLEHLWSKEAPLQVGRRSPDGWTG